MNLSIFHAAQTSYQPDPSLFRWLEEGGGGGALIRIALPDDVEQARQVLEVWTDFAEQNDARLVASTLTPGLARGWVGVEEVALEPLSEERSIAFVAVLLPDELAAELTEWAANASARSTASQPSRRFTDLTGGLPPLLVLLADNLRYSVHPGAIEETLDALDERDRDDEDLEARAKTLLQGPLHRLDTEEGHGCAFALTLFAPSEICPRALDRLVFADGQRPRVSGSTWRLLAELGLVQLRAGDERRYIVNPVQHAAVQVLMGAEGSPRIDRTAIEDRFRRFMIERLLAREVADALPWAGSIRRAVGDMASADRMPVDAMALITPALRRFDERSFELILTPCRRVWFWQAVAAHLEALAPVEQLIIVLQLGKALLRDEQLDGARKQLEAAVAKAQRIMDADVPGSPAHRRARRLRQKALRLLSDILVEQGQFGEAADLLNEARGALVDSVDAPSEPGQAALDDERRVVLARLCRRQARVAESAGDLRRALWLLRHALKLHAPAEFSDRAYSMCRAGG